MKTVNLIPLAFFAIVMLLGSCGKPKQAVNPTTIPIKPFYIFNVGSHGAGVGHHWYKAIDKNGFKFEFVDTEGKYSIGDSIK